ncbi:hypothetical protein FSP39_015331 [Pinctada imbricata]|uniref:Uncharacterized protein n=1 Tax=Pinctada imbricata TaxID=66713 RepID=A0AA88Y0L5_PINIB|nr:hypothetical protein FSP39_015331 [Pinctada imbricata]
MKPMSPEYSMDMPSTAGTYTRGRPDSIPTANTATSSRESPSLVGSEAHMIRTMSMIEQFWAYMIWGDLNSEEKNFQHSVLDHVYLFMGERYLIDDIMYLCTHDLLTSVAEYSSHSKTIQVFGNILAGNLDGSAFRYTMLMCDFIKAVDWKEVEDFRAFAHVVYPFMGMEHKIIPVQNQQPPTHGLTWKEFNTSLEEIVTTSSEKIRRKLYSEAETAARFEGYRETVPLMRLARILLISSN